MNETRGDQIHQKLIAYYLDVLSSEIAEGISEFSYSKYGFPDYALIENGNPFSQHGTPYQSKWVNEFARKRSSSSAMDRVLLGYPVAAKELTSKKGNRFFIVIPIFLIPYQDGSWQSGNPQLDFSSIQLNIKAVREFDQIYNDSQLLTEYISLSEELGLYRDTQPAITELIDGLLKLRGDQQGSWSFREAMDPGSISSPNLPQIQNEGIYNGAALFGMPEKRYTKGLEKELQDLKGLSKDQIRGTAFHDWAYGIDQHTNDSVGDLLSPIPLNEEQCSAIEKSIRGPLTVVTGPPGTGKSQLVTGLIANAAMQGQKVLFASKNNKAVDVVAERVNNITNRSVLIRLGRGNYQQGVVETLNSYLTDSVTRNDVDEYQNLKNRLKSLEDQQNLADRDIRWYVDERNDIESLSQRIEDLSSPYSEDISEVISENSQYILRLFDSIHRNLVQRTNRLESGQVFFRKWSLKRLCAGVNDAYKELKEIGPFRFGDDLEGAIERSKDNLKLLEDLVEMINLEKKRQQAISQLQGKKSLEKLYSRKRKLAEDQEQCSFDNFRYWLKTLPVRMTSSDRKTASDFLTMVKLIINADEDGSFVGQQVYAQYYANLEKLKNVFFAWAITSLSVRSRVPFQPHTFDLVVIDEASQCDIASALPLLYRAKKAVIIGDGNQLRHISLLRDKQDMGLMAKYDLMSSNASWSYSQNSLYDLAVSIVPPDSFIQLRDHHRSHSDIIEFSNQTFYGESLRIFTKYEKLQLVPDEPIVRWIDVENSQASPHFAGGTYNAKEAGMVLHELQRLVGQHYSGSIGVVSPFRAQVNYIKEQLNRFPDLEAELMSRDFLIDTVHRFQGDERDVMIFSPTIAEGAKDGSINFLKHSGNLFNVAITRARAALITIGDKNYCSTSGVSYLEKFVQYIDDLEKSARSSTTGKITADQVIISEHEDSLYEALLRQEITVIRQEPAGPYFIDLAIVGDERKLAIEVDGRKYHQNWDGEYLRRDMMKNHRLVELGWDVMRFWNYQIDEHLDECVQQIDQWVKEKK